MLQHILTLRLQLLDFIIVALKLTENDTNILKD